MQSTSAERQFEYRTPSISHARACRPLPAQVADVVLVQEASGNVLPRIHDRLAIILVGSPTVVRLESRRSIVADRHWMVLVPSRQLYALRTQRGAAPEPAEAPTTLLVASPPPDAARLANAPAVVSDADLGAQFMALVAHLQRPVRPVECERSLQSLIERVIKCGTPVAAIREGNAAEPLIAVRNYLHAHVTDQVSTATLGRISGLTESHLIRAFHHEFGLPPHAYHLRLRLARACDLLASGVSVSTAAYECGFADQSHLSRKFKETYALTPAVWARAVATPS